MNAPRLVTRLEAAEWLRVSPHTVTAMVRDGRLRPTRVCRRLLFEEAEIARLVREAQSGSVKPVTTTVPQPPARPSNPPLMMNTGISPRGWPR
jgi:excisionase family DNA binding protein